MGELVKNNNFTAMTKAFDTDAFDKAISDGVRGASRQNKWTKKKSFAPSGIGYGSGTCPRYWYYAFHGAMYEYDSTAPQIANMDAGSAAGVRLADMLRNSGMLVADEVPVDHQDPPIGGFIDAIVNWQGQEIVGEIKTTKTETWQHRASQMKAPGYQLIQLLIYMKVMNKDRGFFLVENKNDHGILIIPVKMNEQNSALVDSVFEWMRTVKANSDADLLPTRPFTPKSLPCKGCPVRSTCWEGYERTTAKNEGSDPAPGVVTLPILEVPK